MFQNIWKFPYKLVGYLPMRIFLLVYFMFSILVDPWVDSKPSNLEAHSEIQVAATEKHAISAEKSQTLDVQQNQESHHHNDCPESCPEHTCHLGHCGVIVGDRILGISPASNEQFSEYRQFVPSGPVFGIKRPPKFNA